jgi:4-aminobutyrate aminotransferase-like enzyme
MLIKKNKINREILIKTKIPTPKTANIINSLKKNEPRSMHGQLPIIWSKAYGHNVYDIANNKFIDFTSTIFVANIGHSNPRLKSYLKKTINSNLIHTYAYPNLKRKEYLIKLLKFAKNKFDKAFLLSSGTEATEAAIKLMKLNGIKNKKKKLGIINFEGNWHGRTMGAQMVSGNKDQKNWIGIKDSNVHSLPFPYPWIKDLKNPEKFLIKSLKKLSQKISLKNEVCGIMIETFQGWGAIFYPEIYIQKLVKICKKNKILVCFDEMQSGFGRTGKHFGFEHYNVVPDLICCGKGMGGGLPLSGVLGNSEILDLPKPGDMSSTNSANPLSCSAGLAVIDEIYNKKIISKMINKEKILFKILNEIKIENKKYIKIISGKGLIAAIIFELTKDIEKKLKRICMNCMTEGLLVVYTGRESIKIGPPLVISNDALKKGLLILKKNIKKEFAYDDLN